MKHLFLIFIFSSLLFSESINLNLKQFAQLVSSHNRVNIIVDNSIKSDKFSFYLHDSSSASLLPAFKRMLELKELFLTYDSKNKFYYIHKKKENKKTLHTIKLNTLTFDDVKLILEQYEDMKFSYISNTNTVMFISNYSDYISLKNVISINDILPNQLQIKITVVESNLDNAKDRGFEISSYSTKQDGSFQYFINLLTNTATSPTSLFTSASTGLYASLKYLDDIGVSNIKSSPFMLIQSGKSISFASVENVPYLTTSASVTGASSSKTEQVSYKDVGLKINLLPKIVNNIIFIDLTFSMESFIDKTSLTPSFSKQFLKNSFQLKKGQVLVLSGFNQEENSKSTIGIPFLMKLPYLGQVFRYDRDIKKNKSLSIMIEVM
ncbi:MAG: hypothetical protein COA39_011850 [Sulfurimonas sp.]|nr:hypothetical protein [Sulfurimonas sp.]